MIIEDNANDSGNIDGVRNGYIDNLIKSLLKEHGLQHEMVYPRHWRHNVADGVTMINFDGNFKVSFYFILSQINFFLLAK